MRSFSANYEVSVQIQCKLSFSANYGRDDLFLVFICFWAEKWTSADVMTFFSFFFGLHLLLGGKMDICGRDDLFCSVFTCFWAKKIDICGRDDFLFWSSLFFRQKTGHLRT